RNRLPKARRRGESMTEAHPAHLTGNASRDDEGTTAALGRLVINNRIAKALGITKRKEERKSHERNQYISRGVSRQQDEPANDNVERPSRSHSTISGSPRKMSTTLWSLTGYRPDAQPCRDRQAERLLIDRQRLSHR